MWLFHSIKKRPLLYMEGQKVLRSKTTSEPKTFSSFHRCFYTNYSILPYIYFFRISSVFCYFSLQCMFHLFFIQQRSNANTFTAFTATHCSSACTDRCIRRFMIFKCWRKKRKTKGDVTLSHYAALLLSDM